MKKRPDIDNLDELKLSPRQVQTLARSYECEISILKIEIQKLFYALDQIIVLRRNLSTRAFEESLSIGITANNAISNASTAIKLDLLSLSKRT